MCLEAFGQPYIVKIATIILHCCVFQVGQTTGARGGDLQVLAPQLRRGEIFRGGRGREEDVRPRRRQLQEPGRPQVRVAGGPPVQLLGAPHRRHPHRRLRAQGLPPQRRGHQQVVENNQGVSPYLVP